MFGRVDETTRKPLQRIDNTLQEKVIETEIKECQRKNGEYVKSTSRNLRERYNDEVVTRVLRRLSVRKYRDNKYQEKETTRSYNER